jgi:hypothetical protein
MRPQEIQDRIVMWLSEKVLELVFQRSKQKIKCLSRERGRLKKNNMCMYKNY